MTNFDRIDNARSEFATRMLAAAKEDNNEAFVAALCDFGKSVEDRLLAEAREMRDQNDAAILQARGVRQLTSEESTYYNKMIEAMRSSNPKAALSELDVVMPKTTIDAIFDDLTQQHPLLEAIDFQNTESLIEILVNTNSTELATWSPLTAEITKELTSGFKKITLGMHKLSAFIPVAKAMLDLGPAWLDRYVRAILTEALYNGLEAGIISGDGKDAPIGMTRQVGEGVTVTGGKYPEKTAVELTALDPVAYGKLLATLTQAPNGKHRAVASVIMVVNPVDYLTKVMPATTIRAADGTYVSNVLPFPTTIIQSVHITEGKAIVGLPKRYFAGLGTAKSGKLEYSDEYHFLEDERVYATKLYGHGEPLDNNAFVLCDISKLEPAIQEVNVKQVKGTVTTKAEATPASK